MTIIIFIISFLGLAILFLSKNREIKTGEKSLIGKILARFDQKSEELLLSLHHQIYQLFQSIKFFFLVHLPEKGKVKIEKTRELVVNGYNKQKKTIMGKKELPGNNPSSFFLRKVSEYKNGNASENSGKGRIEESL